MFLTSKVGYEDDKRVADHHDNSFSAPDYEELDMRRMVVVFIIEKLRFPAVLLAALAFMSLLQGSVQAQTPIKVILDTDFGITGDDGQTLIMAAQLHKQGVIDLLGITLVTGNDWLQQETADALRGVERLGIDEEVGVYAGSLYPLVHDPKSFAAERDLFGYGESYQMSFHKPEPKQADLVPPLGSFAGRAKVQKQHAVDFIIDTVRANPGEISLLVIGPVTNIAMAIRKDPDIVPMIKQIVYMGGAFDVRGNTTPAAELNIWIDPEAARIVIRSPVPQAFIPLDVTNLTQLDKAGFDRIVAVEGANKEIFVGTWVERDANASVNVFDTLALAYLIDPTYATKVEELYVDVDVSFGPGYGRTYGYWQEQPTDLLQKHKVVKEFDVPRFFELYVDLMTRPVPVK